MAAQQKPLKPVRNPAHIAFSKDGGAKHVVEDLPRDQFSLELRVATKFVAALKKRGHHEVCDICPGAEPADVTLILADNIEIDLQIVELVDQEKRLISQMRSSYRDAVGLALGEDLFVFNGCRVSLLESCEKRNLPSASSRQGKAIVERIADFLRDVGRDIHTLEPLNIRSRSLASVIPGCDISAIVHRVLPAGDRIRLEFVWTGGYGPFRVDQSRGLLIAPVRSKVGKHYAKVSARPLWLLCYSVDTSLHEDDLDVLETRIYLGEVAHPFAEVWYFFPIANRDSGSIIKVWTAKERPAGPVTAVE